MGSYKLIQDIEAEDHILGPLTLKQFIFFLVCAFCLYFVFLGITKKAWILLPIFVPPALISGFFAFPFGRDQPTEVWALAKFRFIFKPRKRVWDQNGVKDLVTINAPKKVEKHLTKELSQTEVQSRLKALANTLDSRGWAVKNENQDQNMQTGRLLEIETGTDYSDLVEDSTNDIFDDESGALANQFGQMLDKQSQSKRQALVQQMQNSEPQPAKTMAATMPKKSEQNTSWFNSPQLNNNTPKQPVNLSTVNMHTLQPLGSAPPATQAAKAPNPELLKLATNNDLNIATIAREAAKQNQEVTINLQ